MSPWLALAIVVLAPLVGVGVSYNRFVTQRNLVTNSWANIDVELRRRYDLIPNLVETVRAYAAHEQATLAAVTEARARAVAATGSPEAQAAAERPLVASMRGLLAVAEAYPTLKADQRFADLQAELVTTEDRLAAARRHYNANVRDLNRRIESVPSNIVAGWFGFERATYFEVDEVVSSTVPGVDL